VRNKLTHLQCTGHGDIETMPEKVVMNCAWSAHSWIGRGSLLAVRVMMEHVELRHRQRIVYVGCSDQECSIEYPLVMCATSHNLLDAVKYLIEECQADINALSYSGVSYKFDKVLSSLK
jgi:hypothetical protein